MSVSQRQLDAAAQRLYHLLRERRLQVVLAESCTGGLVSATLSRLPGVSKFLCGSAVVYQAETKTHWLGVSPQSLCDAGPVSREVAEAMVCGVLHRTPQADVAAAVTGHLGPAAPPRQDGLAYVAVARRRAAVETGIGRAREPSAGLDVAVRRLRLERPGPGLTPAKARALRLRRQREAALAVLEMLHSASAS